MDRSWYINECSRQLNNPTFYEQQEKDKTAMIQERVAEYVKRMFNNKLIDQKKQNSTLYRTTPDLHVFTYSPKSINLTILDDP